MYSVITGTGSYVPVKRVSNADFLNKTFFDASGEKLKKSNQETIDKLSEITGIRERRHVTDDQVASDIAYLAARDALESAKIDKESLDYIIVAHNFGDVRADNIRSDFVPSLAARVKHKLGIVNPKTVAYDLPFGCPGWLQGVIQANYYLKSGDCKRVMVIGAETLSRISDPHDRDSMIYADGAGATILEAVSSDKPVGILSHAVRSDTIEHAYMLWMEKSYDHSHKGDELYLKMDGHKLYEYALKTVPLVVKESLEKAGVEITKKESPDPPGQRKDGRGDPEAPLQNMWRWRIQSRGHAHDHLLAGQQFGGHIAYASGPAAKRQSERSQTRIRGSDRFRFGWRGHEH